MRIHLDHAATSPLLPEAREAMLPWLDAGNASSLYKEGREARDAIDRAREVLSARLGCLFAEVLFTSSGTEAANMAIIGAALANRDEGRGRVLMSAIEHHCVIETRPILERLGYQVETLPVDAHGQLLLDKLESAIGDDVLLLSLMHANNEIGTLQPVRRAVDLAHAKGALVHCDAVQTFAVGGRLAWKVSDLEADLVTISAHKIGGPKGAGAIYTRAGVILKPILVGGGQEREMRAGTENVAAIAGFAAAVEACGPLEPCARDAFVAEIERGGEEVRWTTPWSSALPGHAHGRFPGVSAESLLIRLDRAGIAASSGAACSSGSIEPSHVLLACGWSEAEAKEGVRFTCGRTTTEDDARQAAGIVLDCVRSVRR